MPKHRKGKKSNVWNQYWLEYGSFGKREYKRKDLREEIVLKDFIKYLGEVHGKRKIMQWLSGIKKGED
jgi:hypothetical protein